MPDNLYNAAALNVPDNAHDAVALNYYAIFQSYDVGFCTR